jgi:hypothetical protein
MTARSDPSSRFMIRNTVAACHAPPLGVGAFRASNSRATASGRHALGDTFRDLAMTGFPDGVAGSVLEPFGFR